MGRSLRRFACVVSFSLFFVYCLFLLSVSLILFLAQRAGLSAIYVHRGSRRKIYKFLGKEVLSNSAIGMVATLAGIGHIVG